MLNKQTGFIIQTEFKIYVPPYTEYIASCILQNKEYKSAARGNILLKRLHNLCPFIHQNGLRFSNNLSFVDEGMHTIIKLIISFSY